ncbi:MAG: hypothetical protein KF708_08055 [Pirellulales bacterium]|nr:hypothetical protein [Pirellulales bacterium]
MTLLVSLLILAANPSSETLPSQVDLRPQFEQMQLSPRSQGRRNTCSVFVTVGAFEFALSKARGEGMPLSVEYLNWACNQHIGNKTADRGQFFHHLLAGFDEHGLCRDELMPYESRFAGTEPSDEAKRDAEEIGRAEFQVHWIRRWSKSSGLSDEEFAAIRETLAAGWPVCAGSNHSRLFVGYRDDPNADGGGVFLTRDSVGGRYREVSYAWAKVNLYDLFWVELPKSDVKSDID